MKLEIESTLEFEHSSPSRLVARPGANIELECRIDCSHSPSSSLSRSPRIRIEKLGGSGGNSSTSSRTTNSSQAKLVLENIEHVRDGGRYVCYSEVVHDSTNTPFLYFDLVIEEKKSGLSSGISVIFA